MTKQSVKHTQLDKWIEKKAYNREFDTIFDSNLVGEPSFKLGPLRVFLGTSRRNLDMDKIKPLTQSRLLLYKVAIDQN